MKKPLPTDSLICLDRIAVGLTTDQSNRQRDSYGANDILGKARSSSLRLVRDTLRDPMVWFLIFTASLFALVGDYVEASVLALALLPIVGMDAFLHRRTLISTAALAKRLSSEVTVLRDAKLGQLASVDLVPGDVVLIQANDFVPADCLFVSGDNLQVDESALTGEAMPIAKSAIGALPTDRHRSEVDVAHWAFAGTRLLTEQAKLLVVYTGQATQYGEIVRLAQATTQERTPLQQAMMSLTQTLLIVALIFCGVLAATRVAQGHGWLDATISAVTLAVAALPEEFPVVFAFFLGVGVYRLARQQALVRRGVVVENIGRVTCICSDKTGTLTEGRLVLAHQVCADDVSLDMLRESAALASRRESKDPLDITLLNGLAAPPVKVLATFPFSEDRRRETNVVMLQDQSVVACVKGAPETVLTMCDLDQKQIQAWQEKALAFASTGHKVIGFARRIQDGHTQQQFLATVQEKTFEEPLDGYQFLGLMAFEDPVRAGVKQAVQIAQDAGIRVVMVTGDHLATATAIAREVGLAVATGSNVRLGDELDHGDLRHLHVVARATPSQKLGLVQALRREGEVVAVTGDGVNDVPALKGADIGIAMGERGTQAAREVASIVLLDDNFRTIVRAIAEGRQLFANLQLSFAYLLMIHIPLVITAAWIPLAGYPLLYLPIHIVLLELIIHPTALLAFQQRAETESLTANARTSQSTGFFSMPQWGVIVLVGLVVTVAMITTFERSLAQGSNVEHARAVAIALIIAASVAMTTSLTAWRTRAAIVITVAVMIVSFMLTQLSPVAALLHLKPLHWDDWLIVLACAAMAGALARGFLRVSRNAAVS